MTVRVGAGPLTERHLDPAAPWWSVSARLIRTVAGHHHRCPVVRGGGLRRQGTVGRAATRLNTSSNRRPPSVTAQRCNLVCILSTRCDAANGRCSAAPIFTGASSHCTPSLQTYCRPFPCVRLSRTRTTTAPSLPRLSVGNDTYPSHPWLGCGKGKSASGSRVHVFPIDEGGTWPGRPPGTWTPKVTKYPSRTDPHPPGSGAGSTYRKSRASRRTLTRWCSGQRHFRLLTST